MDLLTLAMARKGGSSGGSSGFRELAKFTATEAVTCFGGDVDFTGVKFIYIFAKIKPSANGQVNILNSPTYSYANLFGGYNNIGNIRGLHLLSLNLDGKIRTLTGLNIGHDIGGSSGGVQYWGYCTNTNKVYVQTNTANVTLTGEFVVYGM